MYEDILDEVESILESTAPDKSGSKCSSRWDTDLSCYAVAYAIESFGRAVIGEDVELNAEGKFVERAELLFPKPDRVTDSPFDNSSELWWESVKEVIKDGVSFRPDGVPNYDSVLERWITAVSAVNGWKPNSDLDIELRKSLEDTIQESAENMSYRSKSVHISRDVVIEAAGYLFG